MKPTKIKIVLCSQSAYALQALIENVITNKPEDENDKLMMAGLAEILENIIIKTAFYQTEYCFKLTAVQALSLRLMYTQVEINGAHFNNELLQISNQIHQQYFI